MSDGLTVDGGLLDWALPDALSGLVDPPQPAVMRAAAVKITRVLDEVTVNHLGPATPRSHLEHPHRYGADPAQQRR